MTQNRLTIISRNDITPGYQAVQSGHALIQFHYEYPEITKKWYSESNYLIYLSVQNEEELITLIAKLEKSQVKYSIFREPDIENQITAIAIEPSEQTRRLTSSLPKMLREYSIDGDGLIDKNTFLQKQTVLV